MAKKTSGKPQENQNTTPIAARAETANGNGNGNSRTEQQGDGSASRELMFSNEEIAERAYQIYEREGRTDGRAMDHWLQAESELREERQNRSTSAANTQSPQSRQDLPRSARRHHESTGAGA